MTSDLQKQELSQWFTQLQTRICDALEEFETEAKFTSKSWKRPDPVVSDGGGGTMRMIQGQVFEKGGVNVSTVFGQLAEPFAHEIPGTEDNPHFWASGLSLVVNPTNPFIPAIHMNTRHIATSKSWFGGGTDLTPTFEFEEDSTFFHKTLEAVCNRHHRDYYPKFKKWCDEYFYLPHRKEPRGIGGIFYDTINSGSFDDDFAFTRDVGEAFLEIYPEIVRRRIQMPWTQEDKAKQLFKRAKYAEFNLLYDRGVRFGLKTEGNIEAIFMSMPPLASW